MGSYQFYECVRCDRDFRSQAAKEQHMRYSSRHNICHLCGVRDYEDADDLDDHLKNDHHYCKRCDQIFYGDWLLEQHNVDEHNLCVTCGRRFTSPSNLNNHKIIHAAKDIECVGCNRQFATNSAMVLHLEAGTCPSEVDCQVVDDLAFDCHQYPNYRCDDPKYDYECPSCETLFQYMSGLLQHIENGPCDEDLGWHSLWRFFFDISEHVFDGTAVMTVCPRVLVSR